MLDYDLAEIYGYEVKNLNRQVKRNIERFPEDFMFQLTKEEYDNLRCQNVTAIKSAMSRSLPYAFTEQGLSKNLNKPCYPKSFVIRVNERKLA